jgi:hypothetical protein
MCEEVEASRLENAWGGCRCDVVPARRVCGMTTL